MLETGLKESFLSYDQKSNVLAFLKMWKILSNNSSNLLQRLAAIKLEIWKIFFRNKLKINYKKYSNLHLFSMIFSHGRRLQSFTFSVFICTWIKFHSQEQIFLMTLSRILYVNGKKVWWWRRYPSTAKMIFDLTRFLASLWAFETQEITCT